MPNATRVTRGGVTYVVPEPTLRADEVVHSLRIGGSCYFFAGPVPTQGMLINAPGQARAGTWLGASKEALRRRL